MQGLSAVLQSIASCGSVPCQSNLLLTELAAWHGGTTWVSATATYADTAAVVIAVGCWLSAVDMPLQLLALELLKVLLENSGPTFRSNERFTAGGQGVLFKAAISYGRTCPACMLVAVTL